MIIHTPTQENYDALMQILDTKGYRWVNGDSLLSDNAYHIYGKETCIDIALKTGVTHGDRVSFLDAGFKSTSFTEALKILQPPMLTLENMPVGTVLKNGINDFVRVLAALGGEGELAVYVISYSCKTLESKELSSVNGIYSVYDLKRYGYTIHTPSSDVIEVDGKKYALIK